MGVMQPKRYRKRCEQQIGMSIQENFAPLLRNCAQLAAAEEDTDKRTVRSVLSHISCSVVLRNSNSRNYPYYVELGLTRKREA